MNNICGLAPEKYKKELGNVNSRLAKLEGYLEEKEAKNHSVRISQK